MAMKRRELFKMFATLAAMPLVAPLAVWCKAKPQPQIEWHDDLDIEWSADCAESNEGTDSFAGCEEMSVCRYCGESIGFGNDTWWHIRDGVAQTGCYLRAEPTTKPMPLDKFNDLLQDPYTMKDYWQYRNGHTPNRTLYGRGRWGMPETWQWKDAPFNGEQS